MLTLTHPQKRIVVNQHIFPDSKFAYMYGMVYIDGQSVLGLTEAINAAVRFFDCLRCRFIQTESQILQNIADFKYEYIESKPSNFVYLNEKLNLLNDRLYRFYIVTENDKPSGYFFILHHAIVDAYTITLIIKYIKDFLSGKIDDDMPRSFSIFAKSEREYLQSEDFKADRVFFERNLRRSLNYKYVPEFDLSCERIESGLSVERSENVLSFCKQKKISVFKLYYAALFLLLFTEDGKNIQTVSTTHHNRSTDELLQIGGMFTSTIPVVQEINPSLTFEKFLVEVCSNITESVERHRFPIDISLAAVKDHSPFDLNITEVMINSIPFGDGSKISRFSPNEDISCLNFKLNPNSKPKGANIETALDFRTNMYTRAQAERILKLLTEIVFMFIEREDTVISDVLDNPDDIIIKIEHNISKNPERVALAGDKTFLTYHQMGEIVDRVASVVSEAGNVIGVINERSVWYVVAVLGILKAGKAFTPIDIGLPPQRLDNIIGQMRMKTILTFSDDIDDFKGSKTIDIRTLRQVNGNLPVRIGTLAYILFTSGSSGTPKGVMVGRRGLFFLLESLKSRLGIECGERFSAYCDFSFDVSIAEIFLPLISGSTLFITNEEQRHNLRLLNEFISTNKIDRAFLPTKAGEVFIRNFPVCSLVSLIIAGEKMNHYQQTNYRVYNGYGPTEFTILSHVEEISQTEDRYSIGKPLDGVEYSIVGETSEPCDIGELVLIGEQSAFGYLNDYNLTAKRFIKIKNSDGSSFKRAFKTSDKVEKNDCGKLYFLSRMDRQIKYSGYRIELEEVESAAINSSMVQAAACLFDGSEIRLAVIPRANYNEIELLRFISEKIPAYAIPHRILSVTKFPENKAGKTDYEALEKEVSAAATPTAKEFIANKHVNNKTEKKLLKIMSPYVSAQNHAIAVSENIFSSGIDSLGILQIMLEVESKFNYPLRFSDFLLHPTVSELATIIDNRKNPENVRKLREGTGKPLVLLFDISRDIISYQHLLAALSSGYSVYGISSDYIPKNISLEEYVCSLIYKLFEQNESQSHDLVGYSSGGILALEMARQLGEKVDDIFLIDTPNYKVYPERLSYSVIFENIFSVVHTYGLKGFISYMLKYFRDFTNKRSFVNEGQKLMKMIIEYSPIIPESRLVLFVSSGTSAHTDINLGWQVSNDIIVRLKGDHISAMKTEASKIARIIERRRNRHDTGAVV